MLHLVRRFFGFLTARPLTPQEQIFINRVLTTDLQRLFYTQRVEDQRHALDVVSRVPDTPELVEAALMHDIGKTRIRLGAIGRALATMWFATSLPVWGQWLTYRDHGPIGADLLEANGGRALAVSFARYHPGEPPTPFDRSLWTSLAMADHA